MEKIQWNIAFDRAKICQTFLHRYYLLLSLDMMTGSTFIAYCRASFVHDLHPKFSVVSINFIPVSIMCSVVRNLADPTVYISICILYVLSEIHATCPLPPSKRKNHDFVFENSETQFSGHSENHPFLTWK